jgi:Flp pilus assembly CpaF family ATPase
MTDDVISVVNRSNQRGGRMLSLADLVEADTFTLEQAAWVTERIEAGASILVGANPGRC